MGAPPGLLGVPYRRILNKELFFEPLSSKLLRRIRYHRATDGALRPRCCRRRMAHSDEAPALRGHCARRLRPSRRPARHFVARRVEHDGSSCRRRHGSQIAAAINCHGAEHGGLDRAMSAHVASMHATPRPNIGCVGGAKFRGRLTHFVLRGRQKCLRAEWDTGGRMCARGVVKRPGSRTWIV